MKARFLLSSAAIAVSASAQCVSIAELVCRVSSLSTLCASIKQAGLQSVLTGNSVTIYGPTNTAFFNLGDRFAEIYNNTDELADLILYHVVDGYNVGLVCGGSTQMANGQNSSTVCQNDAIFQIGEGNSADAMPQIVARNIRACNGAVLNIVDEVLLPTALAPVPQAAESDCKTIAEFVCDSSLLSALCTFVMQVGLDAVLSDASSSWVLFAPSNEAFANLGDDTLGVIATDTDLLTNILLYHLAGGEVLSASDLECGGSLQMTSGTNTTTVCDGDTIYQTGDANEQGSEPEIILPDIRTCNSIIHVTNQVILPSLGGIPVLNGPEEEDINQEEQCQSMGDLVCNTANLSTFCAILTEADFISTLNKHSWTLFAPLNEAFTTLGGTFDDIMALGGDSHLVQGIMLHHIVAKHVIYSADFECNQNLRMAEGEKTRTLCVDESFFQVGKGNDWDALPRIVSADREACNGVLHVVDQLILPELN